MQSNQTEQKKPDIQRLLQFAFISFQGMLAVVLNVLSQPNSEQLAETNFDPIMSGGLQLAAIVALVMSYFVPKLLVKRAPDGNEFGTLFTAAIVRMAMIEFCGIIGFVIGFLSADPYKAYPYLGAAVIALLIGLPMKIRANND